MKRTLAFLVLANLIFAKSFAQQAGNLDSTFNPGGIGPNSWVYSMAVQPDGKILIGGDFTSYNGTNINRIARLNSDGTLDISFNPGSGPGARIYSILVQPDGKIIIGGDFFTYNGISRNRIARINQDGSLDNTFNPGSGINATVNCLALQPDGKILVGGDFTYYNNISIKCIARLYPDGTLDTTFNPGAGPSDVLYSRIYSIALQPDGKIIIGGSFTAYDGIERNRIARLNQDGSLDTTFNPGTGAGGNITSVALQQDGKILIGGYFGTYNDIYQSSIARINPDGSLDTSFISGSGANNFVNAVALQPDGKILIGGSFDTYDYSLSRKIARLNPNGSLDTTFITGTGADDQVICIAIQPNGKILIGGAFTTYNGSNRSFLARLLGAPQSAISETAFNTNLPAIKCYPIPASELINIEYTISEKTNVTISIETVAGDRVATLIDETHYSGQYKISWNTGNVAKGVYIVKLVSDNTYSIKKIVIN